MSRQDVPWDTMLRERSYDHTPRVLEITGGTTSSPALDRHKGFSSVLSKEKNVDYQFVNTDWSSEQVYKAMHDWLNSHPVPDIVFCHSDLAAQNAYKAAQEKGVAKNILFLGIDGLPWRKESLPVPMSILPMVRKLSSSRSTSCKAGSISARTS